jgi:hypothetical protein
MVRQEAIDKESRTMTRLLTLAALLAACALASSETALAAKGGFKGGIKPVPFRAHGLFAPVTPRTLSHSGLPAKFHGHHKKHVVQPVIVGIAGGLALLNPAPFPGSAPDEAIVRRGRARVGGALGAPSLDLRAAGGRPSRIRPLRLTLCRAAAVGRRCGRTAVKPSHSDDAILIVRESGACIQRGITMTAVQAQRIAEDDSNEIEGQIREFVRRDVSALRKPEPVANPTDVSPLIQRVAGASMTEIEGLIAELQRMRDYLRSEGERVQRELAAYAQVSETSLRYAEIMADNMEQWKTGMATARAERA